MERSRPDCISMERLLKEVVRQTCSSRTDKLRAQNDRNPRRLEKPSS